MPVITRPSSGPITAKGTYGWRQLPREPKTWHDGLDFAGGMGSPIRAAQSGVVHVAAPNGTFSRYGNLVVIKHDNATTAPFSLYAHLKSYRVRKGQKIKAGQIIGYMGNVAATKVDPGKTVATHLHFEMLKRWPVPPDTDRVDPTPFLTVHQEPALYTNVTPELYPSYGSGPFAGLDGVDELGDALGITDYDKLNLMILGALTTAGYVGYRVAGKRWYGWPLGVAALPAALWTFNNRFGRKPRQVRR